MGSVTMSRVGGVQIVVSLSSSLTALLSVHPLLLLCAMGIFTNAQNAEKKWVQYPIS